MPANIEGHTIPEVVLHTRSADGEWHHLATEELFADKTVVLFALPGAFTPTCSSTHLPRYDELAPSLFANGVDSIVCLAVNDAFVMNEWARTQACQNLTLLPDGNGDFTRHMGMLVDKSDLGFGMRSWRYSMLVRDRVIIKMFIESEQPGDPFQVSDADTMLHYLNPDAGLPDQVAILTRAGCGYCVQAKALLSTLGIAYAEVALDHSDRSRIVGALSGEHTVPQVFINGERIGGLVALQNWAQAHTR